MTSANVPTPEEVIALVDSDGGMQQLIAHARVQQARAVVDAHHALVADAAAAGMAVAPLTGVDVVHMAAAHDTATIPSHVNGMSAIDSMPLTAATTGVLVSPSASAMALYNNHNNTFVARALSMPLDVAPASTVLLAATSATKAPQPHTINRKSIPLSMKKEAIEWIMGPGNGIPSRAEKHFRALHWDVSASSFRKWWKNKDKILRDASHKKRITGGGRKPYLEVSEEKLLVLVIQERAKKDRVTRKWIATTAQHMFQRSSSKSFKASENWVTKFIRRNGLTLKRSFVAYQNQTQNSYMMSELSADSGYRDNNTVVMVDDYNVDPQQRQQQHMGIDMEVVVDDGGGSADSVDPDVRARDVDHEERKACV